MKLSLSIRERRRARRPSGGEVSPVQLQWIKPRARALTGHVVHELTPRENQHSASATVCVHVAHDAPQEPQRIRLNGCYQTRKRARESVCSFLTCTWNSSAVWFSSAAGVSSSCSVRIYRISLMFTLKVSLKPRVTFHDCQPYPSFTMAADTVKPWADSSFFCLLYWLWKLGATGKCSTPTGILWALSLLCWVMVSAQKKNQCVSLSVQVPSEEFPDVQAHLRSREHNSVIT